MAAISSVNYVSAEGCIESIYEEGNNGKCSFTGNCWPDPDPNVDHDCDSTAPNQGGGGDPGGGGGTIDPINP